MYGIYNGYEGGFGHMINFWGSGIMVVIFWAIVIYFIIWLVRNNKANGVNNNNKSVDILKERYAKGEIDKKEFEEKEKDLSN